MVTLLFSDIEGSTARWEQHPAEMSAAIRRHDSVLDAVIAAHGGEVFKTLGDGFCAAFTGGHDAVAAALAAQHAINALDWSGVGGLRVRMALHAGEPERHGSDYLGPPVNRVARLLAAGHGGQVLVSGPLADALRDLPGGIQLRPLGVFRLKDLEAPERIYQLVTADLPCDFPALRTLEAVPNNLPVQNTPLVGRRDDVAAIDAQLRRATLVTVAGPGGAGKTRVALQCAADSVDRMEDGVWFVNLAPLSDSALVAATILAALDAGAAPEGGERGHLLEYLRSRQALLLLDNCEHVIAEVAQIVAAIRSACPRVTVLATSRELLHLDGEHVYRLGPLGMEDAVALFDQRAKAVCPAFDVRAKSASVRSICDRLDGIPLAIELAAARIRALSADEILARLDERFRLLTNGKRTALHRQQTLRALIDWSYDLLDPREQALFRRLAAFRGTFSLPAAAALFEDEEPDEYAVLDLLTSLADKSLIAAAGERTTRYRLLESIAEYALAKNVEHQAAAITAQRHAAYFAREAAQAYREFDSRMPQDWLERAAPDLDNLRAALHWTLKGEGGRKKGAQLAADSGPIFLRLQLLAEGLHWCALARSVADLPPGTRGQIEYVASMMHNNLDDYRGALTCAEAAVAFYRLSTDERGLVRALSQTAQHYARAHRFEDANAPAAEAIQRARNLDEPELLVAVLRRCAFALPAEAIDDARSLFAEALETARACGESQEACRVLEWWAEREAAAGCFDRAIRLAREGLQCCADPDSSMCLESNIAGYALACGRPEEAGPHARRALDFAVEAQHELACAIAVAYCAPLHAARDPQQAALLLGYATARMRALQWEGEDSDRRALQNALSLLESRLQPPELTASLERGARCSLDDALAILAPASAVR